MTWNFDICATQQRRLFSRILQILEGQMVGIPLFTGEAGSSSETRVHFVVESEADRAHRIEALLYRLEGVRSVSVVQLLNDGSGTVIECTGSHSIPCEAQSKRGYSSYKTGSGKCARAEHGCKQENQTK
jgi:hypothetical protein